MKKGSVDFANKAIEDFNFLFTDSVLVLDCFMYEDFFNQRIQEFDAQFGGIDIQ